MSILSLYETMSRLCTLFRAVFIFADFIKFLKCKGPLDGFIIIINITMLQIRNILLYKLLILRQAVQA